MSKHLIGLTFLAAMLPSVGAAQTTPFPQTLPANTVVGRMGIGPGPSQAIPFATLSQQLFLSTTCLRINLSGQSDKTACSRGPLFIWNDPAANLAGQAVGQQTWIGSNPTATPGANDFVAGAFYIDNLNSRANIWAMNIIQTQAILADGGASGIAHGIEINNIAGFAVTTPTDPYTTGSAMHAVEMVANTAAGAGAFNPQVGLWIWSAGDFAPTQPWWNFGVSCARVVYACVGGQHIAGDIVASFTKGFIWDQSNSTSFAKVDGTHTNIFDFADATVIGNFAKGLSGGASNFIFTNGANQSVTATLDSGSSAAQTAALAFSDRAAGKWALIKDSGNNFLFQNVVGPVTAWDVNGTTSIFTHRLTFAQGGSSNGVISFATQAAAGTYNWNWPITAGSSGDLLTSQGGVSTAMSWTAPSALTVGTATNATNATNVTITNDTTTNAEENLTWVSGTGSPSGVHISGAALTYNPSTGVLGSSIVNAGSGAYLAGGVATFTRNGGTGALTITTNGGNILMTPNGGTVAITGTLTASALANSSTTSAVCYNTGTGALTYNSTVGTCTVSDGRLKTAIAPITGALDKILQISGVYFDWKEPSQYGIGRQVGVVAQDVARVFPELVATDSDGKISADYQRLVAPIIEGMRELRQSLANANDRIKELEARGSK